MNMSVSGSYFINRAKALASVDESEEDKGLGGQRERGTQGGGVSVPNKRLPRSAPTTASLSPSALLPPGSAQSSILQRCRTPVNDPTARSIELKARIKTDSVVRKLMVDAPPWRGQVDRPTKGGGGVSTIHEGSFAASAVVREAKEQAEHHERLKRAEARSETNISNTANGGKRELRDCGDETHATAEEDGTTGVSKDNNDPYPDRIASSDFLRLLYDEDRRVATSPFLISNKTLGIVNSAAAISEEIEAREARLANEKLRKSIRERAVFSGGRSFGDGSVSEPSVVLRQQRAGDDPRVSIRGHSDHERLSVAVTDVGSSSKSLPRQRKDSLGPYVKRVSSTASTSPSALFNTSSSRPPSSAAGPYSLHTMRALQGSADVEEVTCATEEELNKSAIIDGTFEPAAPNYRPSSTSPLREDSKGVQNNENSKNAHRMLSTSTCSSSPNFAAANLANKSISAASSPSAVQGNRGVGMLKSLSTHQKVCFEPHQVRDTKRRMDMLLDSRAGIYKGGEHTPNINSTCLYLHPSGPSLHMHEGYVHGDALRGRKSENSNHSPQQLCEWALPMRFARHTTTTANSKNSNTDNVNAIHNTTIDDTNTSSILAYSASAGTQAWAEELEIERGEMNGPTTCTSTGEAVAFSNEATPSSGHHKHPLAGILKAGESACTSRSNVVVRPGSSARKSPNQNRLLGGCIDRRRRPQSANVTSVAFEAMQAKRKVAATPQRRAEERQLTIAVHEGADAVWGTNSESVEVLAPQPSVIAAPLSRIHREGFTVKGADTQFQYTGDITNGQRHGQGSLIMMGGAVIRGDFVHGEITGKGVKQWPDGSTYEGYFLNGEPHGNGGVYVGISSGEYYEGGFRFGDRDGYGVLKKHPSHNDRMKEAEEEAGRKIRKREADQMSRAIGRRRSLMPAANYSSSSSNTNNKNAPTSMGEEQSAPSSMHRARLLPLHFTYRGTFARGKFEDPDGTLLDHTNKSVVRGGFSNGLPHGDIVITSQNGDTFAGVFFAGEASGDGTFICPQIPNPFTDSELVRKIVSYFLFPQLVPRGGEASDKQINSNGAIRDQDDNRGLLLRYEGPFVEGVRAAVPNAIIPLAVAITPPVALEELSLLGPAGVAASVLMSAATTASLTFGSGSFSDVAPSRYLTCFNGPDGSGGTVGAGGGVGAVANSSFTSMGSQGAGGGEGVLTKLAAAVIPRSLSAALSKEYSIVAGEAAAFEGGGGFYKSKKPAGSSSSAVPFYCVQQRNSVSSVRSLNGNGNCRQGSFSANYDGDLSSAGNEDSNPPPLNPSERFAAMPIPIDHYCLRYHAPSILREHMDKATLASATQERSALLAYNSFADVFIPVLVGSTIQLRIGLGAAPLDLPAQGKPTRPSDAGLSTVLSEPISSGTPRRGTLDSSDISTAKSVSAKRRSISPAGRAKSFAAAGPAPKVSPNTWGGERRGGGGGSNENTPRRGSGSAVADDEDQLDNQHQSYSNQHLAIALEERAQRIRAYNRASYHYASVMGLLDPYFNYNTSEGAGTTVEPRGDGGRRRSSRRTSTRKSVMAGVSAAMDAFVGANGNRLPPRGPAATVFSPPSRTRPPSAGNGVPQLKAGTTANSGSDAGGGVTEPSAAFVHPVVRLLNGQSLPLPHPHRDHVASVAQSPPSASVSRVISGLSSASDPQHGCLSVNQATALREPVQEFLVQHLSQETGRRISIYLLGVPPGMDPFAVDPTNCSSCTLLPASCVHISKGQAGGMKNTESNAIAITTAAALSTQSSPSSSSFKKLVVDFYRRLYATAALAAETGMLPDAGVQRGNNNRASVMSSASSSSQIKKLSASSKRQMKRALSASALALQAVIKNSSSPATGGYGCGGAAVGSSPHWVSLSSNTSALNNDSFVAISSSLFSNPQAKEVVALLDLLPSLARAASPTNGDPATANGKKMPNKGAKGSSTLNSSGKANEANEPAIKEEEVNRSDSGKDGSDSDEITSPKAVFRPRLRGLFGGGGLLEKRGVLSPMTTALLRGIPQFIKEVEPFAVSVRCVSSLKTMIMPSPRVLGGLSFIASHAALSILSLSSGITTGVAQSGARQLLEPRAASQGPVEETAPPPCRMPTTYSHTKNLSPQMTPASSALHVRGASSHISETSITHSTRRGDTAAQPREAPFTVGEEKKEEEAVAEVTIRIPPTITIGRELHVLYICAEDPIVKLRPGSSDGRGPSDKKEATADSSSPQRPAREKFSVIATLLMRRANSAPAHRPGGADGAGISFSSPSSRFLYQKPHFTPDEAGREGDLAFKVARVWRGLVGKRKGISERGEQQQQGRSDDGGENSSPSILVSNISNNINNNSNVHRGVGKGSSPSPLHGDILASAHRQRAASASSSTLWQSPFSGGMSLVVTQQGDGAAVGGGPAGEARRRLNLPKPHNAIRPLIIPLYIKHPQPSQLDELAREVRATAANEHKERLEKVTCPLSGR